MFGSQESEIDFDSFTKFPLFCYKLVFFDFKPLKENANLLERMKHAVKINYFRFYVIMLLVCVASFSTFSIVVAESFVAASENIPNIVTGVLIISKISSSLIFRQEIWDIFEVLRATFTNRGSDDERYKVKEYLDNFHRVVRTFAVVLFLLFVPIAMSIVTFLITGVMKLPVNYWYPFDAYQPHTFPIALTWVNYAASYSLIHMLAADSLLFALMTVLAMEFDFLKLDLTDFHQTPSKMIGDEIKSLIKRHNVLLDIGDRLQSIYETTFLCCFMISSTVLCFLAFHLSAIPSEEAVAAYSFYVPYLSMICGQVLLLCVFGQKVSDSSEKVAEGVYNCNWEEFEDESVKKHLLMMIMRSQRPTRLTAMNFGDVSLASFKTVRILRNGAWLHIEWNY